MLSVALLYFFFLLHSCRYREFSLISLSVRNTSAQSNYCRFLFPAAIPNTHNLLKTKEKRKKYGYSLKQPTLNTIRNTQFKVWFLLNNLSTIGIQRYFTGYINNSFLHGRFYVFTEIWKLKRKLYENLKKECWRKLQRNLLQHLPNI